MQKGNYTKAVVDTQGVWADEFYWVVEVIEFDTGGARFLVEDEDGELYVVQDTDGSVFVQVTA